MFPSKKMMTMAAVFFGLSLFIPVAQAQQPFDITDYFYATVTVLLSAPELSIFHSDVKGITRDNQENKLFDNMTSYCLRSGKVVAGRMNYTTYTKFTDPDGDFIIVESIAQDTPAGVFQGTFTFLHGTGKWKGIKGGGTSKTLFMTRGKQQINPTTFQGYLRMTGTFELPKK